MEGINLMMGQYIGGNPLARNDDSEPIYTVPTHLPPSQDWDGELSVRRIDTASFIEHLYFITMEKNGFSYFYPNNKDEINLCRFEWHYGLEENLYFYRVGILFKVKKAKIFDIKYYIRLHDELKDIENNIHSFEIDSDVYESMMNFIQDNINKAVERLLKKREDIYNVLYYIRLIEPVKEVTFFNNKNIIVLPSYNVKDEFISAVIIPTKGFSYLDSKRFSDEKVNLFLAFLTFQNRYIKLSENQDLPRLLTSTKLNKTEQLLKKIKSFYPEGKEISFNSIPSMESKKTDIVNWLYSAFDKIENSKSKRKIVNIIFSYYSGIENMLNNRTLSLVAFIACMSSIAKLLEPEFSKENGDRKAIVFLIAKMLKYESKTDSYLLLDKWSKKVYNDHRSSYVHGANHAFEAYSQNMDGNSFAGLPRAIPAQDKPVGKQYEYENDFKIAIKVSELMIIKCFESLSGLSSDGLEINMDIDFFLEDMAEGHIGMINKGWVRL